MNGDRPPGHPPHRRSPRPNPQHTPDESEESAEAEEPGSPGGRRRLVTVRHGDQGCFELAVTPGAHIPELVAAAAILPRCVVYTGHRRAAPGDPATILAFQAPPDSPALALVRPPSPHGSGPPPLAACAAEPASAEPGWVPDVATAQACGTRTAVEAALSVLITPAAFGLHGRLLVHGLAHCDPEALIEAADLALRKRAA